MAIVCWLILGQVHWNCAAQDPIAAPKSVDSPTPSQRKPTIDELLLFFPAKYPVGNWEPGELEYQDVSFTSADETPLHGWYCRSKRPVAVVLVCHGNAGNVATRWQFLRELQSNLQASVFAFDYRGYGKSEGVPSVVGAVEDAKAARTKLSELAGVAEQQIVLMGESFGGAIAIELAVDLAPRGLVLQSTFSSLRDVAEVHYPTLAWLVPIHKLNSVAQIGKYQGPVLVSHGKEDRTVPFQSGRKLFDAANEPKKLIALENVGHNNWFTSVYQAQLKQFLRDLPKEVK